MGLDANPLLALLAMLHVASAANVCSSAVCRQCDSCVCVCAHTHANHQRWSTLIIHTTLITGVTLASHDVQHILSPSEPSLNSWINRQKADVMVVLAAGFTGKTPFSRQTWIKMEPFCLNRPKD